MGICPVLPRILSVVICMKTDHGVWQERAEWHPRIGWIARVEKALSGLRGRQWHFTSLALKKAKGPSMVPARQVRKLTECQFSALWQK